MNDLVMQHVFTFLLIATICLMTACSSNSTEATEANNALSTGVSDAPKSSKGSGISYGNRKKNQRSDKEIYDIRIDYPLFENHHHEAVQQKVNNRVTAFVDKLIRQFKVSALNLATEGHSMLTVAYTVKEVNKERVLINWSINEQYPNEEKAKLKSEDMAFDLKVLEETLSGGQ